MLSLFGWLTKIPSFHYAKHLPLLLQSPGALAREGLSPGPVPLLIKAAIRFIRFFSWQIPAMFTIR